MRGARLAISNFYHVPSTIRLRNIGRTGEAHGLVWQLIVPAGEQAGIIAATANYLPRGMLRFMLKTHN